MRIVLALISISISLNLFGQEQLAGYYASNVADLGFFAQRIQLNKDSSFKFEYSGDLHYFKGSGKYHLVNRIIYLTFEPQKIDKNDLYQLIHAADTAYRPMKYLFKTGKLWMYHVDGHVVKWGKAVSRHKKFLLFGDHYLTRRRMYLKKIEGKELIWRGEKASR